MKPIFKFGMLVLTIMALSFTSLTLSGCDDDDDEIGGGQVVVKED